MRTLTVAKKLQKLFADTNRAVKGNWVVPEIDAIQKILDKYAEQQEKALEPHKRRGGHLVESAGYWFDGARKAQSKGKMADALMSMENAYNHVENALAAEQAKLEQSALDWSELRDLLHLSSTDDDRLQVITAIKRLEQSAKDSARLDWLEQKAGRTDSFHKAKDSAALHLSIQLRNSEHDCTHTIRESIDAAIAQEAKT